MGRNNVIPTGFLRSSLIRFNWIRPTFIVLVSFCSIANFATGETTKSVRVSGGGRTIIEGGTGGSSPVPVTTLLAFHAESQNGDFECLAFAPSAVSGAGSGDFNTNVMYVTGKVTSLRIEDGVATLRGTATVTGIGVGQGVPFTVAVRAGGPGATIKLIVSGLTFSEILVDGHISFSGEPRD